MAGLNDFFSILPTEISSNDDEYRNLIDTPKPVRCKFCGKTLYYDGLLFPNGKKEWLSLPQKCDCADSIRHRKECQQALFAYKEKKARIDKNLRKSGLCKRYLDRVFLNFSVDDSNRKAYMTTKEYAENFSTKIMNFDGMQTIYQKFSLYITGNIGLGKSHLAAAIGNFLIKNGVEVRFTSIGDLLLDVRKTYDSSSEGSFETEVLNEYINCDLLILDDFGKEKLTEWGVAKLFEVINGRYKNYKPLVITSNYPLNSVLTRLIPSTSNDSITGKAIVDRLYEICLETVLKGISYRKTDINSDDRRGEYGN